LPIVYSPKADAILSTGVWLGPEHRNWALTKAQAFAAVGQLLDAKCIILGGDVLNGPGKNFSPTYDNWYYKPSSPPTSDDLSSSAYEASSYIKSYPVEDAYFVLVPWSE
jgi:Immunity protein 40